MTFSVKYEVGEHIVDKLAAIDFDHPISIWVEYVLLTLGYNDSVKHQFDMDISIKALSVIITIYDFQEARWVL